MADEYPFIAPEYMEKLKGARLIYYHGENQSTVNKLFIVFFLMFIFLTAIICPIIFVWEHIWEGQALYGTVIYLITLSRFIIKIVTYHTLGQSAFGEITTCDHGEHHKSDWRNVLNEKKIVDKLSEAGTVVNWGLQYGNGERNLHGENLECCFDADNVIDFLLLVRWDCGFEKMYSRKNHEWKLLRVFDMGPAGLKSHVLLCDVCKESLTGFSFRCTNIKCSHGRYQIYDLCYKHYNEDYHHHNDSDHRFRVSQLYSIGSMENINDVLKLRSKSRCCRLVGLFPEAHVVLHDGGVKGEIIKVVHEGGQTNPRKAKFWNCTAEFKNKTSGEIKYHAIGAQGQVTMKAVVAGDGGFIYAEHFPSVGDQVLLETIRSVQKNMYALPTGEEFFISNENNFELLSLTDTDLQNLNCDELWKICNNIEVINLLHNKLESLPPSLMNHHNTLKIATLSYNCFEEIPNIIFSLQNLENLNMISNLISVVPQSIQKLRNLTHLYLSDNNIFSLADTFSSCENLNVLCLDNNHLSHIPSSVRRLPKLQTLELHHNNLQDFQVLREDFKRLKHLSLHCNRLQVLPKLFKNLLSRLDSCSLHCNPFTDPKLYRKLIEFDNCATKKGIINDNIKFTPRKGFRVLLIGACGSGKSSIIKVLCKHKYVTPIEAHEHNHTIGIEQHVYHFESSKCMYELSMWDFAGEDSYLMMNYMFFSEGTLVWLVVKLDKFQADLQSYQTMIGVWLRAVVARVRNPCIWIIGTHSDLCSPSDVRLKTNKIHDFVANEYASIKLVLEDGLVSEITCSVPSDGNSFNSMSIKIFPVSNTYKRDGYHELRQEIQNIPFSGLSKMHDELPIQWQRVHLYLNLRAAKHLQLVEKHSTIVESLCNDRLATSTLDANDILNYFHETGDILIISINDEKKVFLDVMQLIYILKQLFCHNLYNIIENKLKLSRDYDSRSKNQALALVSESGIIAKVILKKLWSPLGVSSNNIDLLIDLLIEFKIAYKVIKHDETCYLFPFLLKPCNLPCQPQTNTVTKHIIVHCEFGFIPCGLFENLLCSTLPYLTNNYTIHRNLLKGSALNNTNLMLFLSCVRNPTTNYSGLIKVHVEEKDISTNQADYSALWQLVIDVMHELEQLRSAWYQLKVSKYLLCPLCKKHSFPLQIPPISTSTVNIECSLGDINLESVIPPIRLFLDDLSEKEVIDLACKSQCELRNPMVLAAISNTVDVQWKSFALQLHLVDARTVERIEYDYPRDNCVEKCLRMLLANQRNTSTKVGDLAKACSNSPNPWIKVLKATLKVLPCTDKHYQ